jgi:hypothetical protein
MNKERIIFVSRILLVAGIVVVALGVFLESWDPARLSSLKAKRAQIAFDRDHDYYVEPPIIPINEKDLIAEPQKPGLFAPADEKKAYDKDMAAYNAEKDKLNNLYNDNKKKYDQELKDYNKKRLENRRALITSEGKYARKLTRLNYSIMQKDIDTGRKTVPLIIRFLGTLVLLAGSLGILVYGEMYERLGVLFLIGFAFKTIIGL